MISFSIVICTYNPELEIFQRLLDGVLQFDIIDPPEHEVIIVDNNSSLVLSKNVVVKDFLSKKKNARIIRETTAGLTSARIAGIENARYEWIVFFDDDNEPAKDYLNNAAKTIGLFPQVGAWGPGTVDVVYLENNDNWFIGRKVFFQQRNESKIQFSREKSWQPYYPFGTGLIIKKEVASSYALRVESGQYTLSDRKGKSLASGGDVQMVLTAIEMGFAVGAINNVALNHLISSSKANLSYLQRQQYGVASAYIKAYNQVFPNNKINVGTVSNHAIAIKIYSLYRIHYRLLSKKDFKLLLAEKMGEINAAVFATNRDKPILLKVYEKIINA